MRLAKRRIMQARRRVSIHASVKDATIQKAWSYFQVDVSIHASVKDATGVRVFSQRSQEFQSTHL